MFTYTYQLDYPVASQLAREFLRSAPHEIRKRRIITVVIVGATALFSALNPIHFSRLAAVVPADWIEQASLVVQIALFSLLLREVVFMITNREFWRQIRKLQKQPPAFWGERSLRISGKTITLVNPQGIAEYDRDQVSGVLETATGFHLFDGDTLFCQIPKGNLSRQDLMKALKLG